MADISVTWLRPADLFKRLEPTVKLCHPTATRCIVERLDAEIRVHLPAASQAECATHILRSQLDWKSSPSSHTHWRLLFTAPDLTRAFENVTTWSRVVDHKLHLGSGTTVPCTSDDQKKTTARQNTGTLIVLTQPQMLFFLLNRLAICRNTFWIRRTPTHLQLGTPQPGIVLSIPIETPWIKQDESLSGHKSTKIYEYLTVPDHPWTRSSVWAAHHLTPRDVRQLLSALPTQVLWQSALHRNLNASAKSVRVKAIAPNLTTGLERGSRPTLLGQIMKSMPPNGTPSLDRSQVELHSLPIGKLFRPPLPVHVVDPDTLERLHMAWISRTKHADAPCYTRVVVWTTEQGMRVVTVPVRVEVSSDGKPIALCLREVKFGSTTSTNHTMVQLTGMPLPQPAELLPHAFFVTRRELATTLPATKKRTTAAATPKQQQKKKPKPKKVRKS